MMDAREFQENLLIHGADPAQWPEELRIAGLRALENSPELQALLEEYVQFEQSLRNRRYEGPRPDLAERILAAAATRKGRAGSRAGGFLSAFFPEFAPGKAALVTVSLLVVSILVIGFAIGFSDPLGEDTAGQEQTSLQEFLYYQGELL